MPYPTTDSNPNPKVERKMGYTRKKLHDLDERKKEAERRKAAVLATCAPPSAREREKGERAWLLGERRSERARTHSLSPRHRAAQVRLEWDEAHGGSDDEPTLRRVCFISAVGDGVVCVCDGMLR